MSRHRFFHEKREELVELRGPEAHHLSGVLRLKPGQIVELFDGVGFAAEAEIVETGRGRARLQAAAWRERRERELPGRLTLISALPKGKRLDWMLEKAVELGVAAFAPLTAERSVRVAKRRDDADDSPPAVEVIRRVFLEAAKQCGRNVLPAVLPATTVERCCTAAPIGPRLFGKPGAPSIRARFSERAGATARPAGPVDVTILIGPEGGLTEEEEGRLESACWLPAGLAPAVLRIETAAIAALAQVAGLPTS